MKPIVISVKKDSVTFEATTAMNKPDAGLRNEVHELAENAFHHHLISGYGDSEYADEYQIVLEGKPRHLPLSRARSLLGRLLRRSGDRAR